MLLPTRMVEKPWGKDRLPPPFEAPAGQRIGEIRFEPPRDLPQLLVKYIFAGEKLSIQVHPSNEQAEAAGLGSRGKEECWLVVDAEPGAVLGIGFRQDTDAHTVREAALRGTIEEMLAWHEVRVGDFFYIPANTVHAIGAGVSIIEIQQNSDVTYRLFDYGRPRELHLEQAVGVAEARPHDPAFCQHLPDSGDVALVEGPHFRLDRVDGIPDRDTAMKYRGALLVVPLTGHAVVENERVAPGQSALAHSIEDVVFSPRGSCLMAQPCPGAVP